MPLLLHQRLPSPVLPTAMSATRSMQTSSSACHIGPPTVGGDVHEDVPETTTAGNIPSFPGSSRIASTGTLQATLVVSDEEMIPLKIQKVLGNDIFYKHLSDIALQIFGPTIRKRWNDQEKRLKDELTNQMVEWFENDTFDKTKLLDKGGTYLKYVRDQYRTHLKRNLKYERPPMIPEREWKDLILDAKERIERKKGNTPLDARRRLSDMSKATKARQEKHGQHKLGSGGYMKLVARIALNSIESTQKMTRELPTSKAIQLWLIRYEN
ncbi:uncharacterized protein LOC131075808 [Cryptomeria japonica]|uniref:uncharacterized protein LOC131075808 n=1 Tax=Cryptomeria japonica TaxID=3369 RepID=UPI0025AB94B0|nr:uncharacterized protein LOC131075808 [Cryptomeria japonica]